MIAAENAILGCVIQWPDQSLPFLTQAGIRPESFERKGATVLFRVIVTEWLEKRPVGVEAVAMALKDDLVLVGGMAALYSLTTAPALPSTLDHYAGIVKEAHARRRLAKCLTKNLAAIESSKVHEIIAAIESEMGDISSMRNVHQISSTNAIVGKVVKNLLARTGGAMAGLSTGIARLDEETGGIRPEAYWVVAGPTKGGKSALVRYMVQDIAIRQGKLVLLFGLEMSNEDTVEALIATDGKISASRMRDGKMSEMDHIRLPASASAIASAPLLFRDDVYDMAGIRSYVRQVKSAHPDLAVVVVDYLQLTEGAGNLDRRELEIATVSKALRRMAKDENVAVIALAQVNDDGELRECRAIGMDATVQITIELTDKPGARRLRLRQRQGKTGIAVPVAFLGDTFEWHPLAEDPDEESQPAKRKWKR